MHPLKPQKPRASWSDWRRLMRGNFRTDTTSAQDAPEYAGNANLPIGLDRPETVAPPVKLLRRVGGRRRGRRRGGSVLRAKVLGQILHEGIHLIRGNIRSAVDHRLYGLFPIVQALVRLRQI